MKSAEAGMAEIELLIKEPEPGEIYEGKVTRVMPFGAFIEILPGKEGLLGISKMAKHRVEKVEDVMNVGDTVKVKVTEIDSQNRINLSRKRTAVRRDKGKCVLRAEGWDALCADFLAYGAEPMVTVWEIGPCFHSGLNEND